MPAPPDHGLVADLRAALHTRADPARAPAMQAYMKSAMPFLGIGAPALQALVRDRLRGHVHASRDSFVATVRELWFAATYREERYTAILVASHRSADVWQRLPLLPLYRELAVTGAWWDLVDPIATQRLLVLLDRDTGGMTAKMRAWARLEDIWLRRCAILCQLKRRARTDVSLLQDCLEPSIDHGEFFVRKAMGWALREYAKTDAAWVRRFLRSHRDRLSGLTIREASKHITP